MKHALITMIGLAAMTLPAMAQQTEIPATIDASRSPQVEIPEGAFEIALPNLGTLEGLDELGLPAIIDVSTDAPEAPRVIVMTRIERAPGTAAAPKLCRASVRIISTDSAQATTTVHRVIVISGDSIEADPEHAKLGRDFARLGRDGRRSPRDRSHMRSIEIRTSSESERATAAPMASPEVSEYSRPEPEPPTSVELLEAANAGYSLSSPVPNPVSASASISFTLPRAGRTTLAVFDNTGRIVATLADETLDAGTHARTFDASGLPAGLYLYRLSSGSYAETKTMTVVR